MICQVVDQNDKMNNGFYSRLSREPRLLFGGYPSQSQFEYLKSVGVRYFIDLTTPIERKRLPVYNQHDNKIIYINFPIRDNFIPYNMEMFNEFINWLVFTIGVMNENEFMYIHCKGGHGRSGMVMCCILCAMHNLLPEKSIEEVTISHKERPLLTSKWKTRVCPSNEVQQVFVRHLYQCNEKSVYLELENACNQKQECILNQQNCKK